MKRHMKRHMRQVPRTLAVVILAALGTCAMADSNLPGAYPAPACGERPDIPERPEKFETEEALAEYNGKVRAYNTSMDLLIECVRGYVANAAADIAQIRERSREAIEQLGSR